MIRARAGRAAARPARALVLGVAIVAVVAACIGGDSPAPGTTSPAATPSSSVVATRSDSPTESTPVGPTPSESPSAAPTPVPPSGTPAVSAACSGSDANREFFLQAAASMSWPVYCPVFPDGWFVDTGSYRLADGGHLEVTYRGPLDQRFSLVEGNICAGADVDTCAPRDTVIGPATFGDREGELGRLANGLVLDVDRGASPSWRATGLGLAEDAFRTLCAALLVVEG
ncbi:MAG: hypothetical protein AB1736_05105 [Chloroflexota bacterium]